MCMQMALHLEQTAAEPGSIAGGISYDFRKAFDLVPFPLLFEALKARGAHERVIGPLQAMYSSLQRVFRLKGACSGFWTASNGLLQGCPLSMLALNCVVSVILEVAQARCPDVIARTYADDISATCIASSQTSLINSIAKFHQIIKALEEVKFGEINQSKSYTYGHPCLKGKIAAGFSHQEAFKIVGGGFVTATNKTNQATIEQGRYAKWSQTVLKMRHCPLPWREKSRMLLATKAQATYAQGTHRFTVEEPFLTKIRSNITPAMFSCDFYSMNTQLTFAILLPPQLDPLFGHTYQTLRTLIRCFRDADFKTRFKHILALPVRPKIEGPTRKFRQLSSSIFADQLDQLLHDDSINIELWARQLRDVWRQELLRRAAKNRPQHYHDVGNVDRKKTLLYYNKLDKIAFSTGNEDIIMKQGILRRLLMDGLLTEERDGRHRRDSQWVSCPCGADPTVHHISWECPIYAQQRAPLMNDVYQNLPTCTRYSALIAADTHLTDTQIVCLQESLVNIWQTYVRDYKTGSRAEQQHEPASKPAMPVDNNGHQLKPRPNGQPGVFLLQMR